METLCKNYEKCPIYNGILQDHNATAAIYRQNFCEAGEAGWLKCKRYLVKEKTGTCPSNLLPNSPKSVDDILKSMN